MRRALFVACAGAMLVALLAWTGVFLSTPGRPADARFTVVSGDDAGAVAVRLKERGFVRSVALFKLSLRETGFGTKFQPGTYDLSGAATYRDIAERLASGKASAAELTVRILEGWDLRDILAELERIGYAGADGFYGVTGLPATDHRTLSAASAPKPDDLGGEFPFLKDKPEFVSLEGFLFPDTYRVYRTATPSELVRTLLRNFDRKFTADMRQRIAAKGRTAFDAVTVASIVEREVRSDEDRKIVADIFWRRLDAGMPLQADSTVNYVTGKDLPAVTAKDLEEISRYNTYKYPGLPLGPISNPGLSALGAAVDPMPNGYWYFLTDKDGGVHYAKTFDEHVGNKAKYLGR